jgi:hypothetical protein
MVVPLRRRATKSPAQRTSEGEAGFCAACGAPPNASAWMRWPEGQSRKRSRVSEEMAADSLSIQPIRRFQRRYNEIKPFPRDLVKFPG